MSMTNDAPSDSGNLDDQKKQAEIAKLRAETAKLNHEQQWLWSAVRGVKLSEWITATAAIVLVSAGWFSGFFNASRERLETDKNRLAVEKIELERQNEERRAQLAATTRELTLTKAKLTPFEQEEAGLELLRGFDKEGLRITFAASPNFDGVKVSFTHKNVGWGAAFTGHGSAADTIRLPVLPRAIEAANKFRKLHGIRVRELAVSREDADRLTAHDDIELLSLECAEVDQRVVGGLRATKKLRSLALPGNMILGFDGVSPMTSVEHLDLRDNPIGDDGIASVLTVFPNAGLISLAGTKVTDTAVKDLVKLRGLTYVDFRRTGVTRHGLLKILDCPGMHVLRADNRILTEEVRRLLKERSPALHIYGDDFDGDQPFNNW